MMDDKCLENVYVFIIIHLKKILSKLRDIYVKGDDKKGILCRTDDILQALAV